MSESDGGSGGKDRAESGLTTIRESRLTELAIRRGWIKGQRWPTDATTTELMAVQRERDLTLRERTALAVMTDIAGNDPRIRQIAVKSAIRMEGQNQADELKDEPITSQHVHFHQHGKGMNGTGLHSPQRIERLRISIAEQLGAGGVGEPGGD